MKISWLIALLSICVVGCLAGCAHSTSDPSNERLVRIHGVVEDYDPEALVFYGLDSIPYNATSHVSRVRVDKPEALRGRVITIDLHDAKQKKDEEWYELRIEGANVSFRIPEDLITSDERSLIPVEAVTR